MLLGVRFSRSVHNGQRAMSRICALYVQCRQPACGRADIPGKSGTGESPGHPSVCCYIPRRNASPVTPRLARLLLPAAWRASPESPAHLTALLFLRPSAALLLCGACMHTTRPLGPLRPLRLCGIASSQAHQERPPAAACKRRASAGMPARESRLGVSHTHDLARPAGRRPTPAGLLWSARPARRLRSWERVWA